MTDDVSASRSGLSRYAEAGGLLIRRFAGKLRIQRQLKGANRLHLGCGSNVLPGWANLDFTPAAPGVIVADLTRRIPVDPETVDFVYTEHFVEHLSLEQAEKVFKECHRVLKAGGVLRLSTPDLHTLIDRYLKGDIEEWTDVGWTPGSPCRMLNEGVRAWGHQFVFDLDELSRGLLAAGFSKVVPVPWRESAHEELRGLECRPYHGDLIVEATK